MSDIPDRTRQEILAAVTGKHLSAMRGAQVALAEGNMPTAEAWLRRAGRLKEWIITLENMAGDRTCRP